MKPLTELVQDLFRAPARLLDPYTIICYLIAHVTHLHHLLPLAQATEIWIPGVRRISLRPTDVIRDPVRSRRPAFLLHLVVRDSASAAASGHLRRETVEESNDGRGLRLGRV